MKINGNACINLRQPGCVFPKVFLHDESLRASYTVSILQYTKKGRTFSGQKCNRGDNELHQNLQKHNDLLN